MIKSPVKKGPSEKELPQDISRHSRQKEKVKEEVKKEHKSFTKTKQEARQELTKEVIEEDKEKSLPFIEPGKEELHESKILDPEQKPYYATINPNAKTKIMTNVNHLQDNRLLPRLCLKVLNEKHLALTLRRKLLIVLHLVLKVTPYIVKRLLHLTLITLTTSMKTVSFIFWGLMGRPRSG